MKSHTGLRPACVRREGRLPRKCITKDVTEPYAYYTEVVEYTPQGGEITRTEDLRERGGEHDAVGDHVKVMLTSGDTPVEIAPESDAGRVGKTVWRSGDVRLARERREGSLGLRSRKRPTTGPHCMHT